MKPAGIWIIAFLGFSSVALAAENMSYTHTLFLYTVDHPADWRVKELSKITSFYSPFESRDDKFSENVSIVVEDLSEVPENVTLLDYHRKGMAHARSRLQEFNVLEEAKTDFRGREAILVLYTMKDRGVTFKIRSLTFFTGKQAYVLTYTATAADYEKYFKPAENCIRSIRVSP